MNEIKVSVVCAAYNHERYIADALNGFVNQKTTFPFEVLIHDDASTDRTADIIREYEKKYPTIIKPTYETENQYSKKDGSLGHKLYDNVKGKYIALCEGDDYWIDPYKLQKQFDLLEENQQIDICATGAKTELGGEMSGEIAPASENTIFSPEQVILGGGGFVATASLMLRAEIKKNPAPFMHVLSLDYTTQIAGSLRGGMAYIAESTCVYRLSTPGSWTMHMSHNSHAMSEHRKKVIDMLLCLDKYTNRRFHQTIDEEIIKIEFNILYMNHEYKSLCQKKYKKQFYGLHPSKRIIIKIGRYFPKIADYIWNIRRKTLNG